MQAPGSQSSLREANRQRIIDAVRTFGVITQVELAAATGLSAATVSNIVKELETEKTLRTEATTRSGRRAQAVSLAASSSLGFGVHVGRRQVSVYLADLSHGVALGRSLPLPEDHRHDTTLDRVALLAGETAAEVGASLDDVASIAVALPAALVPGVSTTAIPGWQDVDVAATLEKRLRRPVALVQQADAAALAEARYGALRSIPHALYVRVGQEVEASALIDGVPHRGANGPAGALGHVQVDPNGSICRCGARGCVDTLASAAAMADLLRVSHGPMDLRQIIQATRRGDAGVCRAVEAAGEAIGIAVANAATLLGVERIVVGGETASAGDVLLDPIRAALRSRPLLGDADQLLIPGEVQSMPEAVGAAAIALDQMELPSVQERNRGMS